MLSLIGMVDDYQVRASVFLTYMRLFYLLRWSQSRKNVKEYIRTLILMSKMYIYAVLS